MTARHIAAIAILAVMMGACSSGTRAPGTRGESPLIRALIGERDVVKIEVTTPFQIESGGMVLMRGEEAGAVEITADGRTLEIRIEHGGVGSARGEVDIVPSRGGDMRINGITYAGRARVKVGMSAKLLVINTLPLETYLEGVVPHEIGNPGPDAYAALQAQAITARTYALSRMHDRKGDSFDVFAGVRDQVYRGKERATRAASTAVRDTRGDVLEHDGKLAFTYYSATCGGHTSDIRLVWPQRQSADYLLGSFDRAGSDPVSFCQWVRNYRWRYSFSGKELGRTLRKTIPVELGVPAERVGSFVDLRVVERNPSGRVRRLDIKTTGGTFAVEADRIRWVLMADVDRGRILPSTLFDVERTVSEGHVTRVTIVGGGNGHGVGMCQNGAIGMARKGYSHRMILSHYYPGTSLARRY